MTAEPASQEPSSAPRIGEMRARGRAQERALPASLLAQACEGLPFGMAIADAGGRVLFANRRFLTLLNRGEPLEAAPALAPLLARAADGSGDPLALEAIVQRLEQGGETHVTVDARRMQLESRRLPGGFRLLSAAEDAHPADNGRGGEPLASRDPLLGLPNRLAFRDRVAGAVERAAFENASTAVLSIDLDRFKAVNEALGHSVGDGLLARVADRLVAAVGPGDTVARVGGDEFAILLPAGDAASAVALAARLVDLVGRVYLVGEHIVNVGASIGIAVAPRDGGDGNALINNADLALVRAKEAGRGQFRCYEPEMGARVQTRRALEADLRKALGLREFELFYQPQVNLARDRVEGFEALLRWRHPVRGLVSPADFIPIIEQLGLIVPIGEWALRAACVEAATWPEPMAVAVNLSALQFSNPRFVPSVRSALDAAKLEPERLELEITESVLLTDTGSTVAVLHQLRAMGVRISMDDFGTGYSSLSYLRAFPFDKIKIDQSFVRGMDTSRDCVAIVRAIAGLADALGVATIAEGVETVEQRERVRLEGCTSIQGYLVSKPLPASDIKPLLSKLARVG